MNLCKLRNAAGSIVWRATYLPYGGVYQVLGPLATNDHRFPGQWFQLENCLHSNWHRHYDPTLGRYTQPDPLGMVDGPNRYAYALNSPVMYIDPRGESWRLLIRLARKLTPAIRPLPNRFISQCVKIGKINIKPLSRDTGKPSGNSTSMLILRRSSRFLQKQNSLGSVEKHMMVETSALGLGVQNGRTISRWLQELLGHLHYKSAE